MRKILIVAVALVACKKPEPHGDYVGPDGTRPATGKATAAPVPTPPPPTPADEIKSKGTFAEALAYAKPRFGDTENDVNIGGALLAIWLAKHPSWAAINALPETTIARVLKDSDEERGKRICAGGSVIQITSEKVDDSKLYYGTFMTAEVKPIFYHATGSTGDLVEQSPGRFCGVVVGRHSYSNAGGGTTHAVRLVGMFDLPENRKAK